VKNNPLREGRNDLVMEASRSEGDSNAQKELQEVTYSMMKEQKWFDDVDNGHHSVFKLLIQLFRLNACRVEAQRLP
jgi:hypothetical protein